MPSHVDGFTSCLCQSHISSQVLALKLVSVIMRASHRQVKPTTNSLSLDFSGLAPIFLIWLTISVNFQKMCLFWTEMSVKLVL